MSKRFNDTESSKARWSEYAAEILDDTWEILWEDCELDYQGHAKVLAKKDHEDKYALIEWYYGSCSGCDAWEGEPEAKVREDFAKLVSYFTAAQLLTWCEESKRKPGSSAHFAAWESLVKEREICVN